MTLKWALADDDGNVKSRAISNPYYGREHTPIFEQSLMTITPETLSGFGRKTDSDKLGQKCSDEEAWNPTLYSISTSCVLKANWALWVRQTQGRCFDQERVRRH